MPDRELAQIIGVTVQRAWAFCLFGERLFRREVDGSWTEYR